MVKLRFMLALEEEDEFLWLHIQKIYKNYTSDY